MVIGLGCLGQKYTLTGIIECIKKVGEMKLRLTDIIDNTKSTCTVDNDGLESCWEEIVYPQV